MDAIKGESSFIIPEICKRARASKAVEKTSKIKERDVKKVFHSKLRYLKKVRTQNDKLEDDIATLEIEEKSLLQTQNASGKSFRACVSKSSRIENNSLKRDLDLLKMINDYEDKLNALHMKSIGYFRDIESGKIYEAFAECEKTAEKLAMNDPEDEWADSEIATVVMVTDEETRNFNRDLDVKLETLMDEEGRLEMELEELQKKCDHLGSDEFL